LNKQTVVPVPIFIGGPVRMADSLHIIHTNREAEGSVEIVPEVFYGGVFNMGEEHIYRQFYGSSEWGAR
jgi:hypothetical protein